MKVISFRICACCIHLSRPCEIATGRCAKHRKRCTEVSLRIRNRTKVRGTASGAPVKAIRAPHDNGEKSSSSSTRVVRRRCWTQITVIMGIKLKTVSMSMCHLYLDVLIELNLRIHMHMSLSYSHIRAGKMEAHNAKWCLKSS